MNTQDSDQQVTTNWSQIKSEGHQRSQRIGQIFQTAFSETKAEFQSGFTTIRPLAQEMTATVVDDLKQKGTQAATQVNHAWADQSDSPDLVARMIAFLKALLGSRPEQVATQMRRQADRLDADFAQRYGDRYHTVKQRFQAAKVWYVNSTSPWQSEPVLETPTQSPTAATAIVDVNVIE